MSKRKRKRANYRARRNELQREAKSTSLAKLQWFHRKFNRPYPENYNPIKLGGTRSLRARLKELGWPSYSAYLVSEHWRDLTEKIL